MRTIASPDRGGGAEDTEKPDPMQTGEVSIIRSGRMEAPEWKHRIFIHSIYKNQPRGVKWLDRLFYLDETGCPSSHRDLVFNGEVAQKHRD